MTKIPNVDWEAIKHPTDARQDNMREVRTQLGGSAASALGVNAQRPRQGCGPTQATPGPPSCQCPYGWHALNRDCNPAYVPQYDGWPIMGVGETLFSPEEIAHWRAQAIRLYQDSMNEVQAANERRYMPETTQPQSRRYLEGDTEFSDDDIEHYYRGNCPEHLRKA